MAAYPGTPLWNYDPSGGMVSAEIKIHGGLAAQKLKYGEGGHPKSLPTHPLPYFLNGIALNGWYIGEWSQGWKIPKFRS